MATDCAPISAEQIDRAKAMLAEMEAGNAQAADDLLDELTAMRETGLYQELGKLTRQVHESLMGFQLDPRLTDLVSDEIPDVKDRLKYVISQTDQAAHRTLTAIEEIMPVMDDLIAQADGLIERWQKFRQRELSLQDFRLLAEEIDGFFSRVSEKGSKVQSSLTDVLMAQEFQDLVGQVIKRVITLVQDLEQNMVELVKATGQRLESKKDKGKEDPLKAEGPHIPGKDTSDKVAQSQDDVDDLLASLGF